MNCTFAQQTILETFENSTEVPEWINANEDAPLPEVVANPSKGGLNPSDSVMLWIKAKDAPVYAAAMSGLEAYNVQFDGNATFIHVKKGIREICESSSQDSLSDSE